MNQDFYYSDPNAKGLPNEFRTGMAVASFVIALVNAVFLLFMGSFILAPISIILAVISLATKRGGKGFAFAGIIISAIGIAVFSLMMSFAMKISPDIVYFENNSQAIISEFEETGEIPERYEKYRSAEYDKYWSAMGCEDFDEFFKMFIESYMEGSTRPVIPEKPEKPEYSEESRDRETPVEL